MSGALGWKLRSPIFSRLAHTYVRSTVSHPNHPDTCTHTCISSHPIPAIAKDDVTECVRTYTCVGRNSDRTIARQLFRFNSLLDCSWLFRWQRKKQYRSRARLSLILILSHTHSNKDRSPDAMMLLLPCRSCFTKLARHLDLRTLRTLRTLRALRALRAAAEAEIFTT